MKKYQSKVLKTQLSLEMDNLKKIEQIIRMHVTYYVLSKSKTVKPVLK